MNQFKSAFWATLVLAVVMAVSSGCRRKPTALTVIPGHTRPVTNNVSAIGPETASPLKPGEDVTGMKVGPGEGPAAVPLAERSKRENMREDREAFKANTVYFDFDSAVVKKSEHSKIDKVASALKAQPTACVEIEGHCDERGTEEYNRALGERRALAVRDYLIQSGLAGDRIFTISYGEDKPAVPGHNEAAWAKNRRAEFILLLPK
jgi:peptidoglycan-associated lipoprotein